MNPLKDSLVAIISLFLFQVIIFGCSSDSNENVEVESVILLSPKSLNLTENGSGTLTLSIVPSLETAWEIISKPDWISINSLSGTFKGVATTLLQMGRTLVNIAELLNLHPMALRQKQM